METFSWPISELKEAEIANRIIVRYADLLRSSKGIEQLFLRVIAGYFYTEVSNLIFSLMVYSQFAASDLHFVPAVSIDNYSWQMSQRKNTHKNFELQIPKYNLKSYKNWAKSVIDPFKSRDYAALSININETANWYAKSEGINLCPVYSAEYFTPLSRFFRLFSRSTENGLLKKLSMLILDELQLSGEDAAPFYEPVKEFVSYLLKRAQYYFSCVLKGNLTKKTQSIYTGTQGHIVTRMVSMAVMEHGGDVHSFPHMGGFLNVLPFYWMSELLTTSKPFCYTDLHKTLLAQSLVDYKLDNLISPSSLSVLPHSESKVCPDSPKKTGKIKKAVYVMTSLAFDDKILFDVVLPTVRHLYLEIQIIDLLLASGLEVILKLHRKDLSNQIINHQIFLLKQRYDSRVEFCFDSLDYFLENSSDDVDLFVVENFSSGGAMQTIKTEKLVMIFSPLGPEKALLERGLNKRMKYIPVFSDEKNRPTFNKIEAIDYLERDSHAIDFEILKDVVHYGCAY